MPIGNTNSAKILGKQNPQAPRSRVHHTHVEMPHCGASNEVSRPGIREVLIPAGVHADTGMRSPTLISPHPQTLTDTDATLKHSYLEYFQ